jgi:hypothetical protein
MGGVEQEAPTAASHSWRIPQGSHSEEKEWSWAREKCRSHGRWAD